jgi:hypothetical protein
MKPIFKLRGNNILQNVIQLANPMIQINISARDAALIKLSGKHLAWTSELHKLGTIEPGKHTIKIEAAKKAAPKFAQLDPLNPQSKLHRELTKIHAKYAS